MPDMRPAKIPVSEQDPKLRAHNFEEVTLGYTAEEAAAEADRCLSCKHKPCMSGCPVGVRIPEFIEKVREGRIEEAYDIIKSTNSLPAVCGRVCPQENQCEGNCVRGIKGEPVGIGRLERFCADFMADKEHSIKQSPPNGHKVAVIGAGPSGLTAAGDLAKLGYDVTVFEAFHTAGGVLSYGIPEFRLPKAIVKHEVEDLEKAGVRIMTDMVIGKVLSVDELMEQGFEAVFIGSGAGLPRFMGIQGENLIGVYSANEYLTRINLMKAYKETYATPIKQSRTVAVVGGGNVAMDAARSALRLGAEKVFIVYRRSMEELPARKEEVHHAAEEGIEFLTLTNPTAIIGDDDGRVIGMDCVKMKLTEPDESGRRRPEAIDGSDLRLDCDTVIMALGTSPNPMLRASTPGLEVNKRGCFIVDEASQTTRSGVFAGGDAVTGAATVILAMGAGKKAAEEIDRYIRAQE